MRYLTVFSLVFLLLSTAGGASAQIPTPATGICVDWNVRSGCGANDQFVEFYYTGSLSGWSLSVGGCSYTFAEDNLSGPFKVIFADLMTACDFGFPAYGTVLLYDPSNRVADYRNYMTSTTGHSWQAATSTNPAGSWTSGLPNPGR